MDRGERLCPYDEGSREPPPSVVAPFSDVQIDRPVKQTDRDSNATFTTVCYHASARNFYVHLLKYRQSRLPSAERVDCAKQGKLSALLCSRLSASQVALCSDHT